MAFGGSVAREALRTCGLFGHADEATLDTLAAALRIRRFRKGETVFHQGDPGDALFIVASGSVKVVLPSDEGAEPAIVAVLGPGEFFGELALLDGAPHSATIVAIEGTETLVLHRDAFLALIDDQPELRRALLASLAVEQKFEYFLQLQRMVAEARRAAGRPGPEPWPVDSSASASS